MNASFEPGRSHPRGAALLAVIVAIAVLTALGVNVAYENRVSLQAAVNARDELRASYLARSGVTLGRLVVHFQRQVDLAMGGGRPPGAAGAGAAALPIPRVQLWNVVPVSSALLGAVFGGVPAETDGAFEAKLEDEDRKVNAQMDGLTELQAAQVQSFLQLVGDPRWDFLFDREDENGVKATRQDVAIHLADWVDTDQTGSALNPERLVLEKGFGDENAFYDRGPDRYRAKNARFDSLEELFLVAGVSDAFMAAFGDRLTVYMPRDSKMNVNTLDPLELVRNALIMADPPGQPILLDPTLQQRLATAMGEITQGGLLAISYQDYARLLVGFGIQVHAFYLQDKSTDKRGAFDSTSEVFRIRARGSAGAVTKSIDAVVTIDPNQLRNVPPQQAPLGRLLRWREE
jgi:general secretion pathway protein K